MFTQVLINSIILAGIYVIVGIGFFLIYSTAKFLHIAHGVVITLGAYFMLLSVVWFRLPLGLAVIVSLVMTTLIGCSMELGFGRTFRKRGSSELVLLLTSLGIYIFLQNVISLVFGDETRSIRTGGVQEGINILGARITPIQVVTIFTSIVLVIALSIFFKKTKIGKAMRAVANDSVLADVSGINSNAIILWAFAISSGLAGIAGILVALDVDMTPTMGMNALMTGIIVVIIGSGDISGIALGALLLATAQNCGAWFIGSQWQDAIAFVILVLFLLIKPQGFFGKKVQSASV